MEQSLHNKIFAPTGCLSEEQLLKYSNNTLPQKEKHKVEKHLLECELCTDAMEGFAFAPAAAEINDTRSSVRQIAQGKTSAVNHWKRFLLAASVIGIAFISFYFAFLKNRPAERNLLSENIKSEQVLPAEEPVKPVEKTPGDGKDISSGETGIPKEIKKNGSAMAELKFKEERKTVQSVAADKLEEVNNKSAREDLVSTISGTSTAMVYDKKNISDMDEPGKRRAEEETKEEPESLTYAEETIQKESEIVPNEGYIRPAAQSPVMEKDDSKNYNKETIRIRKAEESAAGAKVAAKKAEVKPPAFDVKYIENYKVVDYSDEYTAVILPEAKNIPAQFENSEKAKEAESELQLQTKNLMYDDILSEGLANLEAKNYTAALEKFNLILKNYPGDLNAVFYTGLIYYHLGNYDIAMLNFNTVISSDNIAFRDEANWYKALTFQQKNEKEKARALFREISGKENFYKTRASEMLEEMEK